MKTIGLGAHQGCSVDNTQNRRLTEMRSRYFRLEESGHCRGRKVPVLASLERIKNLNETRLDYLILIIMEEKKYKK